MSRSIRRPDNHPKTFIGKYILESISLGMYDHPLMAIREYVQNSADAIDELAHQETNITSGRGLIDITLDGRTRSVRLKDNGIGVPSDKAYSVLHDLGRSEKDPLKNRGFRGIGRLGGLGYCKELRFVTKAEGEETESTSTWDCERLTHLVNDRSGSLDTTSVVQQVTAFRQERYSGDVHDHFFNVEMNNVRCSRDMLLNVPLVKAYLSQVAPVAFSPSSFCFADEIDNELRRQVPTYQTYDIHLNGEAIYKPYCGSVRVSDHGSEEVGSIKLFTLSEDSNLLAVGWMGELELLGTIQPSTLADGLRVRSGNIMVGDKNLLADFYRERRFNNYLMGEIHVVDTRLTPNSRRDDFEDNATRDHFYTCFLKEIGIPYSVKIRQKSKERSAAKVLGDAKVLRQRAERIIECGYLAELQKQEISKRLVLLGESENDVLMKKYTEGLVQMVLDSRHVMEKQNGHFSRSNVDLCKRIFETIYAEASSGVQAEALLEKAFNCLIAPRPA